MTYRRCAAEKARVKVAARYAAENEDSSDVIVSIYPLHSNSCRVVLWSSGKPAGSYGSIRIHAQLSQPHTVHSLFHCAAPLHSTARSLASPRITRNTFSQDCTVPLHRPCAVDWVVAVSFLLHYSRHQPLPAVSFFRSHQPCRSSCKNTSSWTNQRPISQHPPSNPLPPTLSPSLTPTRTMSPSSLSPAPICLAALSRRGGRC